MFSINKHLAVNFVINCLLLLGSLLVSHSAAASSKASTIAKLLMTVASNEPSGGQPAAEVAAEKLLNLLPNADKRFQKLFPHRREMIGRVAGERWLLVGVSKDFGSLYAKIKIGEQRLRLFFARQDDEIPELLKFRPKVFAQRSLALNSYAFSLNNQMVKVVEDFGAENLLQETSAVDKHGRTTAEKIWRVRNLYFDIRETAKHRYLTASFEAGVAELDAKLIARIIEAFVKV